MASLVILLKKDSFVSPTAGTNSTKQLCNMATQNVYINLQRLIWIEETKAKQYVLRG
jgi:hypothetical protein